MDNSAARKPKTITHEQDFKCSHCGEVSFRHATSEQPEHFQIPNGPLVSFIRHFETLQGSWISVKRRSGSVVMPWCPCQPHGVTSIADHFTGKAFDFGSGEELCQCQVYERTQSVEEFFSEYNSMPEGRHFITPPQRLNIED